MGNHQGNVQKKGKAGERGRGRKREGMEGVRASGRG
jgi:hypothetical protein